MTVQIPKISDIPEAERTPLVLILLEAITQLREENQLLKDEIARLKGQKPRPKIEPSTLGKPNPKIKSLDLKRPGSEKRSKTQQITIQDTIKIPPESIPEGSRFKGYQDFVVQDIKIEGCNTLYRVERWKTPDGDTIRGKLPVDISGSHFGPNLQTFILYQYYHALVTQPLLLEQLHEFGIDISSGHLSNIITEGKDCYHSEKDEILAAGLEISAFIQVDDTGARHDGQNGVCTFIGNDLFSYFESTDSKSRINFIELLRAGYHDYVLNADALSYMVSHGLANAQIAKLVPLMPAVFENIDHWEAKLNELGITGARHIQIATEGALLGSIFEHGFNREMVIISDDAGQFNILNHALCWIHAERTFCKLIGYGDENIQALENTRSQIWELYAKLKEYKESPDDQKKAGIESQFDEIFTRQTCFASLNQALKRIYQNKSELLLVLNRPDIPLHNNLSERDIREYVKRRKVSGSTRSSPGRKCRDTFTSLKKTCRKLGVSFWEYVKDRAANLNALPRLSDLMRAAA
jgi:hypothetical protein